ncbi:MAG: efflux RND transporter periplasmic adaptor subunit [Firmicutes bacterium]|nr:efflux RND transporter periplasmic adaptor subunit [Bacillota bacterium]
MRKLLKNHGLLAMLLLAALALCGCGGEQVVEEDRGTAVETAKVAYGTITDATVLRGNVVAAEDVYVIPKAQGVVHSVNVAVGDVIAEGQSICQIDTVDLQTALALVQSQYNTVNSAYQTAVKNRDRYAALYAEGAISLSQLEQAESAVTGIGIDSVRLQVQQVQDQINNCNVKSTVSGIVAELNVDPGDMAGGSYVARVVNIDKVKLKANVTENLIACIEMGMELPVHIASVSDEPFVGVVTSLPVAANQTMTYPVEITIDNPDHKIMGGMFAEVDVVRSEAVNSLIVPKSAVDSNSTVYVVEGETARAVQVETGMSDDNNIEIISGLQAGDEVVTAGAYLLSDGDKVRVVSTAEVVGADNTPEAVDDTVTDAPADATDAETAGDAADVADNADKAETDGAEAEEKDDSVEGDTEVEGGTEGEAETENKTEAE